MQMQVWLYRNTRHIRLAHVYSELFIGRACMCTAHAVTNPYTGLQSTE